MDFSNQSQHDQGEQMTEQTEGHWQPALRPNDDDTNAPSAPLHPSTTTLPIPSPSGLPGAKPASSPGLSFTTDDSDPEEPVSTARLDPAWGIKRTDSAHILDTVHRSPSFPPPDLEVQPASPRKEKPAQELRHTFSQTKLNLAMEDEDEFLHNAQNAPTERSGSDHALTEAEGTEEQSRFDEGLPLIPVEQPEHYSSPPPQVLSQPVRVPDFDIQDEHVSTSFFEQLGDSSQPVDDSRPLVERKETSDVLDRLGFDHSEPDSPPPVAEPPSDLDNSFAAAFAGSMDDDNDLSAAFAQQTLDDDPWKTAMADDDEFLVEDADDLLPDSDEEPELPPLQPQSQPVRRSSNFARSNSNPYAPHQPSTAELTGFSPTTQSVGLPRQRPNPMNTFQPPQQQANITTRAESFVDQAKGGYKSPYDLPMDLAPKKRAQPVRVAPPTQIIPPPPRSSSMNIDKQLQSPFSPSPPTFNQQATAAPVRRPTGPSTDRSAAMAGPPAQPPSNRATSGFFEELPIVPRSRPPPVPQRVPSVQTPVEPPRSMPVAPQNFAASPPQMNMPQQQLPSLPPQHAPDPYAPYQLRPPEKVDPYANVPLQPTQVPLAPAPPSTNARYSPAPASLQNGIKPTPSPRYSPAPPSSGSGPRYSPAPPAQAPGAQNRYVSQPLPGASLSHQPRTSSPLAQHRRSVDDSAEQQDRLLVQHSASSSLPYGPSFPSPATNPLSPPRSNDPMKPNLVPPRRSQTQSPSRQAAKPSVAPRIAPPPNRPASAFGQLSPTRTHPPPSVLSPPKTQRQPFVEHLDFVPPTDDTAQDPLERWKGAPIFRFGFGGAVVTSFPKRVPRYAAGATRPVYKVSAGEVALKKLEGTMPLSDHIAQFPGPLKGKSKKKDVLTWLSASVALYEQDMMSNPSRRLEEKILLWKIVKVLVEQDGNLEGPQSVQNICATLMPEVYTLEDSSTLQNQIHDGNMGIYRPESLSAKTDTVDPLAIEKLRKVLLKGKRDDAVWQAVDSRLWSHALLLASTLDRSVWKQVVAEFVKQEVKTIGSNADSLCALYEVLGGNQEESIDQLVPPSARAGLQMVSRVETSGPTRNALDGLDRWKETLCLILNNRSTEDQRALVTLARLLSDYGRVEAAHICYMTARSFALPNIVGGADDPSSMIVLLGADHRLYPSTFQNDTDSILLTEIYEFAVSSLAPTATGAPMPHLSAYKLQRAKDLADFGAKTEAQAYCDAIASGLKSSTKSSLYYNSVMLGEVEDLMNRLKQIPVSSASWMAKPSVEKVKGSLLSKFSNFVTGEDSDAESKGSAADATEAGPFAKVSGSPALSRNTSQTDLYGSYPQQTQITPNVAATSAGSRYAPQGMNSTRSSSEYTRGRPSLDYQRSPPSTSHSSEPRNLYAPFQQPQQGQHSPLGMSPPVTGYQPASIYQPNADMHMPSVTEELSQSQHSESYMPEVPSMQPNGVPALQPAFGGYTPPPQNMEQPLNEPEQSTFEPPTNDSGYGYQPPEETGYVPYQPEHASDDEAPKPKKYMMDDDDDFSPVHSKRASQAPGMTASNQGVGEQDRKKANDAAAEAAFKAAAEADAQRAKEQAGQKKGSGSWLGGWFGGKKIESLDAGPPKGGDQKVHRVHLGESKMKLYYDKDKKKWINPDNPDAGEKKSTPPPPRSSTGSAPPPAMSTGPPRSVSTPHHLPTGTISRSGTPLSQAVDTGSEGGDSRPGTGHGPSAPGFAATLPPGTQQSLGLGAGSALPTPPGSSGGLAPPMSGPPSRPASALSNASGLDDLLGGPPTAGGRKVSGRVGAKGKKGRYVDVMAK